MTDLNINHIGVIGAGSWGTALAQTIAITTPNVTIYARDANLAAEINTKHTNTRYLGEDITLNPTIRAHATLKDVAQSADVIFMVTPAQHMRTALEDIKTHVQQKSETRTPIVICSKGIEISTGMLMSDVFKDIMGEDHPYFILSGPNFAKEIAKGLPAAATLAGKDKYLGKQIARAIFSKTFRPYVTSDPLGAEIAGAVKNVIAIACGIVYGQNLGENARVAIMTRGMAEIKRMGKILGARPETFLGLSGLGDLTLTCNSPQSRNFSLGVALGKGQTLTQIISERHNVTEGVSTAKAIVSFAKKHVINMPICAAVNATLHDNVSVEDTISALLSRPLTQESL